MEKNHVIFLGAGASLSSGYPIGDSLRLRLSCRRRFRKDLGQATGENLRILRSDKSRAYSKELDAICAKHFESFSNLIDIFRNGGFGTVDEFSKLAASKHPKESQQMKNLMRLAFSFSNPEDNFHKSDYYPFIQRLFREDELPALRNNITIISYNYDCYLDWLLLRAYKQRQTLIGSGQEVEAYYQNKLTSGYYAPHDVSWADPPKDFNLYKVHGSIEYAHNENFGYHNLFSASTQDRLAAFSGGHYQATTPPSVFPWELFDGEGKFIGENDFIFVKGEVSREKQTEGQRLHHLYRKIWEGARDAVQRANKISFVGLSAHSYMMTGLQYLFRGKRGTVETVVANPDNTLFKDSMNRLYPASLCGRMSNMLRKVAPDMNCVGSQSENDGVFKGTPGDQRERDITPRYSFKDFIQTEMGEKDFEIY